MKTLASQFSEVSRLDCSAFRLLMMEPAQRDEIIFVQTPVKVRRERRDVVHRQISSTDLAASIADPAAVIIPVEYRGGLPAPALSIPESVRPRIAREYRLAATLVYLMAYRAEAFYDVPPFGIEKAPGRLLRALFSFSCYHYSTGGIGHSRTSYLNKRLSV